MICWRAKSPFSDDWNTAQIDGPEEEALCLILLGALKRLDYEILISTDGGDEVPLDEM